jgi:hypothetical protein
MLIGHLNSMRRLNQVKAKVNPRRPEAAPGPELAHAVRPSANHPQFADRVHEFWEDLLAICGFAPTCRTLKS